MKTISVHESVGTALAHDLTQIIPGSFKGSRFKKGYIVKPEDVEVLLSMGKMNLFVMELEQNDVHEDDAALRIAKAAAGKNVSITQKGEGKVELSASMDGLLKIDQSKLNDLIEDDEIMFATIHQNQLVHKGQAIAGTRVIPLFVKNNLVEKAELIQDLISIVPLKSLRVGLVITGSEVYHGRINDAFGDVLREKFKLLGCEVKQQLLADDDEEMIASCIRKLIDDEIELIAVTGGMSVDPDDRTPSGIKKAGAEIVTYGAPVLPGAMFLLAYIGDIPVVGLPGCVMYHKISIFDLILPRILAGEIISKSDIKAFAQGGMCQNCELCTFPNCGFGH